MICGLTHKVLVFGLLLLMACAVAEQATAQQPHPATKATKLRHLTVRTRCFVIYRPNSAEIKPGDSLTNGLEDDNAFYANELNRWLAARRVKLHDTAGPTRIRFYSPQTGKSFTLQPKPVPAWGLLYFDGVHHPQRLDLLGIVEETVDGLLLKK